MVVPTIPTLGPWKLVDKLGPNEHRIFTIVDSTRPECCAIADNSGPTPSDTDDGVLWLDPSRPLRIGKRNVMIPVTAHRGEDSEFVTVTSHAAALRLVRRFPTWPAVVDENLVDLRTLLLALLPRAAV